VTLNVTVFIYCVLSGSYADFSADVRSRLEVVLGLETTTFEKG